MLASIDFIHASFDVSLVSAVVTGVVCAVFETRR